MMMMIIIMIHHVIIIIIIIVCIIRVRSDISVNGSGSITTSIKPFARVK